MAATRWGFVALVALSLAPAGPVGAVESISARIDTLNVRLRQTRYAEADSGARALLEIVEAAQGSRSIEAANVLDVLVEALLDQGKSASPETRTLALRAVAIKEKVLGPDHLEVAKSLNLLSNVYFDSGDYAAEQPIKDRVLAIQEKALGPDAPLVARTLYNIAVSLYTAGEYAPARPLAERALRIQEKTLGPDHPSLAYVLNMLGALDDVMGDYASERPRLERALAIQEKAYGPVHPDVANTLINIALLYRQIGDYAAARPLAQRAIAIQEQVLGPDHPVLAKSLRDLALVLRDDGDYAGARPLIERALAIQETALGLEHSDLSYTIKDFGDLLNYTGDYTAARAQYERARAILEKAFGPEHPEVATNLSGLASLLSKQGDYAAARPLYERAQAIWEKAFGLEHNLVGFNLVDMAAMNSGIGDFDAARPLFERGLSILEKAMGPDHPDVAWSLGEFAAMLQKSGHPGDARPFAERAVMINTKALGPDHPDVAASLNLLALIRGCLGETAAALDQSLEAERIGREHLRLTGRVLSERQALQYAAVRSSGLDLALTLAARGLDAPSRRRALDAVVRSRAIVLDEIASRHRAAGDGNDTKIAPLAALLSGARARLANLVVRGLGEQSPEIYRRLLNDTRNAKEQAERTLAEASADFARRSTRDQIGLDAVAATLPAGSALVALVEYKKLDLDQTAGTPAKRPNGVQSYLAFVLLAGEQDPRVVDLGDAEGIDSLVMRWKHEVSGRTMRAGFSADRAEARYRTVGGALRKRVWDPLDAILAGAGRVFLVPDGALNLVNMASLPLEGGGYEIDHGPSVHYVSAERDMVPTGEERHSGGLLLVGEPDYDATSLFASLQQGNADTARSILASGGPSGVVGAMASFRGQRSRCADFASVKFESLPATGVETREIVRLWKKRTHQKQGSRDDEATYLRGGSATESEFKRTAAGRRVLHLATHGFFIGKECGSSGRGTSGLSGTVEVGKTVPPVVTVESPLLSAGLVLAGANHRASAGEGEDDGILTAEEIASLNLKGVEWAVLSACETGVGDVRAGEGVFGLRRAFQVAGAGTLIMSLWSVDDDETRRWMQKLYEGRLTKKLDTVEAVRQASLGLLDEHRKKKQSTHPFYWAAFVAAGDWR